MMCMCVYNSYYQDLFFKRILIMSLHSSLPLTPTSVFDFLIIYLLPSNPTTPFSYVCSSKTSDNITGLLSTTTVPDSITSFYLLKLYIKLKL